MRKYAYVSRKWMVMMPYFFTFRKNYSTAFKHVVMDSEGISCSIDTKTVIAKILNKINDLITEKSWRKQNNEVIIITLKSCQVIRGAISSAILEVLYLLGWVGGIFTSPPSNTELPTKSPTRIGLNSTTADLVTFTKEILNAKLHFFLQYNILFLSMNRIP